jgi:hypothetical protein
MRSLLSALLATLVFACRGAQPIGEDPWLKESPGLFASGWVRASQEDIWPVLPEERFSATQSLQTQQWLVISPTQAERLTRARPKPGKVPYLLRGLCIGCSKGDFILLQRGTEFAVYYGGAAILDTRVRQWPVVAWLDQAPTQLYVSCSVTR